MAGYKYTLIKFVRDWMLIFGMVVGAGAYLIYHAIPSLHSAGPVLEAVCTHLQPILLFIMLFLSFCKIEPHQMRPHRWQAWLLLIQTVTFVLPALLLVWALRSDTGFAQRIVSARIPIESAMLCLICPTATACAVVTGKLGGNMAGVVTYTILINIVVAVVVPLTVPLLYPMGGMSFGTAFSKILAKVFPLLIMPSITAWIVRYLFPKFHSRILRYTDLSFHIWSFSLTLAIAMSTRAVVHNEGAAQLLLWIAVVSLVCCIFQFWIGKAVGSHYGCRVSAGQALGQKNTVFEIWMGYTFMDPVTSVAGGFYSIWHNCFNTWQLYRRRKQLEADGR